MTVGPPVNVAVEVVKQADVIVRAQALEYTEDSERSIRFNTVEVIRGNAPDHLILNGELVDNDDFNTNRVPYQSVRPNGLWGTCFAWQYRPGAEYLLMLKSTKAGALTANWYALAPTNEQLRGADDLWLVWVRKRAGSEKKRRR